LIEFPEIQRGYERFLVSNIGRYVPRAPLISLTGPLLHQSDRRSDTHQAKRRYHVLDLLARGARNTKQARR